jgi:hypothetical protein
VVALLDVNVLVALVDPEHVHHEPAHEWFAEASESGWSTCPLTENGLVRVVSNPTYPGSRTTVRAATALLSTFCRKSGHVFWDDSISLRDGSRFRVKHVQGYRQLTDVYLLGLAVERGGRLATFDGGLSIESVNGAKPPHIAVIAR